MDFKDGYLMKENQDVENQGNVELNLDQRNKSENRIKKNKIKRLSICLRQKMRKMMSSLNS